VTIELGERQLVGDVVALWERACQDGAARGCYAVGLSLTEDADKLGVHKDETRGRAFLSQACRERYMPACAAEATFVLRFNETAGYEGAKRDLEAACDLKDRESCSVLGATEFDGVFGARDDGSARRHFWVACDLGWGRACGALAFFDANGIGGPRNSKNARWLVEQACKRLSYEPACTALQTGEYTSLAPQWRGRP